MEEWIAKLQAKDQGTKWRIAILATVVAMILVIAVWLIYFDSLFAPQRQAAAPKEIRTDEFSFWQSMKGNIKGIFTKDYDVKPQE